MSGLFDKTTQALNTSLNMRLLKQNITSSNIANAETPGYKAQKMDFEESLERAIRLEELGSMKGAEAPDRESALSSIRRVQADIYDNPEIAIKNDGNTVDMEKEMTAMKENTIMYRAALELINKKLAALRYAVTEGNR